MKDLQRKSVYFFFKKKNEEIFSLQLVLPFGLKVTAALAGRRSQLAPACSVIKSCRDARKTAAEESDDDVMWC
jgi:hypothetical protein